MRFGIPKALRGLRAGAEQLAHPNSNTINAGTNTSVFNNMIGASDDYGSLAFRPFTSIVSTGPATPNSQSTMYSGSTTTISAPGLCTDTRVSLPVGHGAMRRAGSGVDDTPTSVSGYRQGRDKHTYGRYIPYAAKTRRVNARTRVRARQPELGYRNAALDLDLAPGIFADSGYTLFPEKTLYEVFPGLEVNSSRRTGTRTIEESMETLSLSSRCSIPRARRQGSRLELDTLGRPYGFDSFPPPSLSPAPSPSQEDDEFWGLYVPSRVHAVKKKSRNYKGYYLELPDLDSESGSDSDSLDSFDDGDDYYGGRVGRRHGHGVSKCGPRMFSPAKSRKSTRTTPTDVRIADSDACGYYANGPDSAKEESAWQHGWN